MKLRLLGRLSVRVTVLSGFAVLACASIGLLFVGVSTPLWVIAAILACRSMSIGLVINPLLQALTQPLRQDQLGDANTLFNAWQRVAGSFGIGVIAALYASAARLHGPVTALHRAALIIVWPSPSSVPPALFSSRPSATSFRPAVTGVEWRGLPARPWVPGRGRLPCDRVGAAGSGVDGARLVGVVS